MFLTGVNLFRSRPLQRIMLTKKVQDFVLVSGWVSGSPDIIGAPGRPGRPGRPGSNMGLATLGRPSRPSLLVVTVARLVDQYDVTDMF